MSVVVGRPQLTANQTTTLRTLVTALEDDRTYVVRFHQTANSQVTFSAGTSDYFQCSAIGSSADTSVSNMTLYVELVLRPGDDVTLHNADNTNPASFAFTAYESCG